MRWYLVLGLHDQNNKEQKIETYKRLKTTTETTW